MREGAEEGINELFIILQSLVKMRDRTSANPACRSECCARRRAIGASMRAVRRHVEAPRTSLEEYTQLIGLVNARPL